MKKNGILRSIKVDQIQMREIIIKMDGNLVSPVASGFSESSISSIVKNATGDYTITLKRPFNSDHPVLPDAFIQELEVDRKAVVNAVTASTLNILVTDLAGLAADCALSVRMIGCDARLQY
jgi:hypothetical protein